MNNSIKNQGNESFDRFFENRDWLIEVIMITIVTKGATNVS